MGQQDPLAEWQREAFDMFEAMMGQIQDQFVAYVSHLAGCRGRRGAAGAGHREDAATPRPRIRCRDRVRCAAAAAAMPTEERGARGGR